MGRDSSQRLLKEQATSEECVQKTNQPVRSGWFNHIRSSCNWKESLQTQGRSKELCNHLVEGGLFGEKKKEERKAEEMKALRAPEPRCVSVAKVKNRNRKKQKEREEEGRKRKKAAAEAEARKKEEDARKKKEAEDFRTQLQPESDIILHDYLFGEMFRCKTQKSLKKQAEYEIKLYMGITLTCLILPRFKVPRSDHQDLIIQGSIIIPVLDGL